MVYKTSYSASPRFEKLWNFWLYRRRNMGSGRGGEEDLRNPALPLSHFLALQLTFLPIYLWAAIVILTPIEKPWKKKKEKLSHRKYFCAGEEKETIWNQPEGKWDRFRQLGQRQGSCQRQCSQDRLAPGLLVREEKTWAIVEEWGRRRTSNRELGKNNTL